MSSCELASFPGSSSPSGCITIIRVSGCGHFLLWPGGDRRGIWNYNIFQSPRTSLWKGSQVEYRVKTKIELEEGARKKGSWGPVNILFLPPFCPFRSCALFELDFCLCPIPHLGACCKLWKGLPHSSFLANLVPRVFTNYIQKGIFLEKILQHTAKIVHKFWSILWWHTWFLPSLHFWQDKIWLI